MAYQTKVTQIFNVRQHFVSKLCKKCCTPKIKTRSQWINTSYMSDIHVDAAVGRYPYHNTSISHKFLNTLITNGSSSSILRITLFELCPVMSMNLDFELQASQSSTGSKKKGLSTRQSEVYSSTTKHEHILNRN